MSITGPADGTIVCRRPDIQVQPQGGRVPSWQTTVVVELAGTTTVVVFAGGGGLLLLMHPLRRDALTNKLERIFILPPG